MGTKFDKAPEIGVVPLRVMQCGVTPVAVTDDVGRLSDGLRAEQTVRAVEPKEGCW